MAQGYPELLKYCVYLAMWIHKFQFLFLTVEPDALQDWLTVACCVGAAQQLWSRLKCFK